MREKTPWILFAAIFGASFLLWKLALEPHARTHEQLVRAEQAEPSPRRELPRAASPATHAEPASVAALAPEAPATQRVRVVVRLAPNAASVPLLGAELLRIDERGNPSAVPGAGPSVHAGPHAALELAQRARSGVALPEMREATQIFEIREPGTFAAGWHAWRAVPGTLTWRPVRGTGASAEIQSPFTHEELLLVLTLAATELALDPTLDAPVANAITHVTAKDG
jgi:hypothetical protein